MPNRVLDNFVGAFVLRNDSIGFAANFPVVYFRKGRFLAWESYRNTLV
jgi:hypothetical protein